MKMEPHRGSNPVTTRLITALVLIGNVCVLANAHSWLHCSDYEVPEGHDFYTLPELLDRFDEANLYTRPKGLHGLAIKKSQKHELSRHIDWENSIGWGSDQPSGWRPQHFEVDPEKDDEVEDIIELEGSVSKVRKERLVSFLGKSEQGKDDMKGFGNCPVFAMHKYTVPILKREEVGLDPCGQCFIVPELKAGIYTFYWHWKFNNKIEGFNIGPNDLDEEYVTCFDVEITPGEMRTCPLAGDGGMYPGNEPDTGREQKPGNPPPSEPGYSEGGPIDEKSVEPCDPASVEPAKRPTPKKSPRKRRPPSSPSDDVVGSREGAVRARRIEKIKRIAKTGNEGGR
ncbi:hypothetical protein BSKO_11676 [Bryopsis sp. KO-2023]|nr:hypothetical protein BSKO_11676 [Bryopsis sp. KO-2023]